ncbi:MAG TPA: hypothetical protein VJH24_03570 [Candidatus Bilamarchaeaceae archaeon]|nr:hypothetical protein [Candidatus Bilamarchaeaceae archaeon]
MNSMQRGCGRVPPIARLPAEAPGTSGHREFERGATAGGPECLTGSDIRGLREEARRAGERKQAEQWRGVGGWNPEVIAPPPERLRPKSTHPDLPP